MMSGVRMPTFYIHPTARLVFWLALMLAVQCIGGAALAVVFMLVPLLGRRVLRRGSRFVWRARWLLVSILVVFSWGVAGEPLWAGPFSPTHEGLIEASAPVGHLLLVLMVVAAFIESMSLPDLLAATHVVLRPLRHLGVDPDRGVVRLMLVLRYVESLPRPRDWRTLLYAPKTDETERLEVEYRSLSWTDYAVILIAAGTVAVFCSF
jgi:energy-coupling factor transporter transmembrane protein EcfT